MRYCSGRSRVSAVRHPENVLQKPVPASGNEFTGGFFMNAVIMWIMAAGAVIGGIDRIMGNRLGLGRRFEEGFELLGATALSMAGIICLVPLLSKALRLAVVPVWTALGLDPAMLGGIIAIDMGGFQLAQELAQSSSVASYSGIIVAATFGCTVSFTIPVGMGRMDKEARSSGSSRKTAPAPSSDRSAFARGIPAPDVPDGANPVSTDRSAFARGILAGLGTLPAALLLGGCLCGIAPGRVLLQSLPVFVLSLCLILGIWKKPDAMVRGFLVFAGAIRTLSTIGLIIGAVGYMTGFSLFTDMTPLEDAMKIVSSIGIVMLGSLPVAELLQRLLRRPMTWVGRMTGMNTASITGLLIGSVSVVPAIAMIPEMDERGKVVCSAYLVCAASALAAHLGFTFDAAPELVVPLLLVKFAGGICGALAALAMTRNGSEC